MKQHAFAVFLTLLFAVPSFADVEISTVGELGVATTSDGLLAIDASAAAGAKTKQVLFNNDTDYFMNGQGGWTDLITLLGGKQAALTNPLVQGDLISGTATDTDTAPLASSWGYDLKNAADPLPVYPLDSEVVKVSEGTTLSANAESFITAADYAAMRVALDVHSESESDTAYLNKNTTGTAANLSGTPALPNGVTATTQSDDDNSTKLATTAYVDSAVSDAGGMSTSDIDTSAEIKAIVGDETGSGALVFATSPTLVTPALGTPSAIDLTNATGFTKYTTGTENDYYGTFLDPDAVYTISPSITIANIVPAAFTITEISISCDADPTTEITMTFNHKTAGIGYGTPTVIEAITTTAGTATITTGFDDATIPAGVKMFVTLSDPDDALVECAWQIEGDWD